MADQIETLLQFFNKYAKVPEDIPFDDYDYFCDIVRKLSKIEWNRDSLYQLLIRLNDNSDFNMCQSIAHEVEHTIDKQIIKDALVLAFKEGVKGKSYWAATLATNTPSEEYLHYLKDILISPELKGDSFVAAKESLKAIIKQGSSEAKDLYKELRLRSNFKEQSADYAHAQTKMDNAMHKVYVISTENESLEAYNKKNYKLVDELLAPFESELSDKARKRLTIAKTYIKLRGL